MNKNPKITGRDDELPAKLPDTIDGDIDDKITFPDWFWDQELRVADLLILVNKGETENVARQIFQQNKNVVFTSLRVNTVANLFAHIYYDNSRMLHDTIESIKAIPHVEKLEFSEVIKVVDKRDSAEILHDVKILMGA